MEHISHDSSTPESTLMAVAMSDAAQEGLLDSDMTSNYRNASIVAEVATAASETGLVEASRIVDQYTDERNAEDVLKVIGRAAIRTGSLDRALRRDLALLLIGGHDSKHYRERRHANAVRRQTLLEISVRRQDRAIVDNTPLESL